MIVPASVIAALFLAAAGTVALPDPGSTIDQARRLNADQHRDQAIALLQERVASTPDDGDARVVLGTMLSWDGRYDEARATLKPLMESTPSRADACAVMINVELWSGHPVQAEKLLRDQLEREPESSQLRLLLARALRDQQRLAAAQREVELVLKRDPVDQVALGMLERLKEDQRWWAISAAWSHDWFSDGRADWNEGSLTLKRATPVGAVLARLSYAHRFSSNDEQAELEFYPSFRPGTYGYVEVGYAPSHNLYPIFRWSADLYQSLGAGFEGSLGWRQLYFSSAVNIGVITLGKYWSDWWFYARGFIVPGTVASPGLSGSVHVGARWYFDDARGYFGLRYARGASATGVLSNQLRNAFEGSLLSGDTLSLDYDQAFRSGWGANARLTVSRDQRESQQDLYQVDLTVGGTYRF